MAKKKVGRANEERKANELIARVKNQKAAKSEREDFSQAAAQNRQGSN